MQQNTDTSPANTGQKQVGRFIAGASGNPNGRPKGSRNRATMVMQDLLEGEAEALSRKAIMLALAGDTTALRLCMERLLPVRREAAIAIAMPVVEAVADLPLAMSAIIEATTSGQLTLGEAKALADLLETQRRILESITLEARLSTLEGRVNHV
jgi:hypothetical protein